ncbi:MAG: hypothetical protein WBV11_15895 [Salegentibacter sp.]
MFSSGQLIFAAIFVVAFVFIIAFSYRKDKNIHRKHYRGSLLVLVVFLLFIALLFVLKSVLNK